MVLILDGNSELGAQVRSNLCYLICLRHLLWSGAVTKRIFFLQKDLFSFMRAPHVLVSHKIRLRQHYTFEKEANSDTVCPRSLFHVLIHFIEMDSTFFEPTVGNHCCRLDREKEENTISW